MHSGRNGDLFRRIYSLLQTKAPSSRSEAMSQRHEYPGGKQSNLLSVSVPETWGTSTSSRAHPHGPTRVVRPVWASNASHAQEKKRARYAGAYCRAGVRAGPRINPCRERERECLKLSHPHKALNTESGPSCLDEEERVSGVRHLNRGLQCCAVGAGCPGQEYS